MRNAKKIAMTGLIAIAAVYVYKAIIQPRVPGLPAI